MRTSHITMGCLWWLYFFCQKFGFSPPKNYLTYRLHNLSIRVNRFGSDPGMKTLHVRVLWFGWKHFYTNDSNFKLVRNFFHKVYWVWRGDSGWTLNCYTLFYVISTYILSTLTFVDLCLYKNDTMTIYVHSAWCIVRRMTLNGVTFWIC